MDGCIVCIAIFYSMLRNELACVTRANEFYSVDSRGLGARHMHAPCEFQSQSLRIKGAFFSTHIGVPLQVPFDLSRRTRGREGLRHSLVKHTR